MLIGLDAGASIWIGVPGGVIVLVAMFVYTARALPGELARFTARFPTPSANPVGGADGIEEPH